MPTLGVTAISEVIVAGGKVATLVEGLADGLDFSDIGKALSAARAVPAAIKDIHLAWDEYLALDDAEVAQLEQLVATAMDLKHKDAEAVIEKAFDFLIELHEFASILPKKG